MNQEVIGQPSAASEDSLLHDWVHLKRFDEKLRKHEYYNASKDFFEGGWTRVIKQYFYKSPNTINTGDDFSPMVIFPGYELAAHRIESVPLSFPNERLTIGDMVLQTAWIRGFSPRLLYLYPTGIEGEEVTALQFVERSKYMPVAVSRPPSLKILDRSLLRIDDFVEINTLKVKERDMNCSNNTEIQSKINTLEGRGEKLSDFICRLETLGFGGFKDLIYIKPELETQYIKMKFKTKSLVDILNGICYCLDASWDWVEEDKIFITPGPGYGTSITACVGIGANCSERI